jgi:methionyl-tRNA synthetase
MYEYEGMKRIVYGEQGATFVPVCEKCGRFVKPDKTVKVSEGRGLATEPNSTCKHCGRVNMPFEGFL